MVRREYSLVGRNKGSVVDKSMISQQKTLVGSMSHT